MTILRAPAFLLAEEDVETVDTRPIVLVVGDVPVDMNALTQAVAYNIRVVSDATWQDVGEAVPACVVFDGSSSIFANAGWRRVFAMTWKLWPSACIVWCLAPPHPRIGTRDPRARARTSGIRHSTFWVPEDTRDLVLHFANLLFWILGIGINYRIPSDGEPCVPTT